MDLTTILQISVTVLSLLIFVALVAFNWSRRRAAEFSAAERLPFLDEVPAPVAAAPAGARHE